MRDEFESLFQRAFVKALIVVPTLAFLLMNTAHTSSLILAR